MSPKPAAKPPTKDVPPKFHKTCPNHFQHISSDLAISFQRSIQRFGLISAIYPFHKFQPIFSPFGFQIQQMISHGDIWNYNSKNQFCQPKFEIPIPKIKSKTKTLDWNVFWRTWCPIVLRNHIFNKITSCSECLGTLNPMANTLQRL